MRVGGRVEVNGSQIAVTHWCANLSVVIRGLIASRWRSPPPPRHRLQVRDSSRRRGALDFKQWCAM